MAAPLHKSGTLQAEPSLFFCSNALCPFHVTGEDLNVRGFGDWASLEDGTTVSHRWIDGQLLCDLCRRAIQQQSRNALFASG